VPWAMHLFTLFTTDDAGLHVEQSIIKPFRNYVYHLRSYIASSVRFCAKQGAEIYIVIF
jgi:hypothetical protein